MQQNVAGRDNRTIKPGWTFEDYRNGRIMLPPFLYSRRMMEFFYTVNFPNPLYPAAHTFNPPGLLQTLQLDKDSHFLWEGITSQMDYIGIASEVGGDGAQLENQSLAIQNLSYGDYFSSGPQGTAPVLRDFSGSGSNPQYFRDPVLLGPNTILQFNMGAGSALQYVENQGPYRFALYGRKVYGVTDEEYRLSRKRQWFIFTCNVGTGAPQTVPANSQEVTSFNRLFSDADFVVRRISGVLLNNEITTYNQTTGAGELLMNIRISSLGRSFFSKKLNARTITGGFNAPQFSTLGSSAPYFPSGRPFELSVPLRVPRNSILEVRAEWNGASDLSTGFISLEGFKVFD
jgi:hypothetical protein